MPFVPDDIPVKETKGSRSPADRGGCESGKGLLFVVSAPSGAGKTSLCKEIMKWVENLQHSISYTTRPKRPSEQEGQDYHFVTSDLFQEMIRNEEFIEWAVVHNHYYGTRRQDLQALLDRRIDVILDIDSQGAMQIRRRYDNGVFIYILPPSFEDLERRLTLRRADAPEEIDRRLKRAKAEIHSYEAYDYLIINDDFVK
ncbi:MAG: guanylate kinase, partial [Nitrospirae bacterium]|nr:guanylate kinase [Nitrospirota bacterium]